MRLSNKDDSDCAMALTTLFHGPSMLKTQSERDGFVDGAKSSTKRTSRRAMALMSPPSSTASAPNGGPDISNGERHHISSIASLDPLLGLSSDLPRLEQETDEECIPELVRARVARVPTRDVYWDQGKYNAGHPFICQVRELIHNRNLGCPLCAWYEWGHPISATHNMEHCKHRAEAAEARRWLEMFQNFKAKGGGLGARCEHCRFPVTLCWRTVYREQVDAKYGNEIEAREQYGIWYREVQCGWVLPIQRFVASRMVVGGIVGCHGVSEIGIAALRRIGWRDWNGLEKNGPKYIKDWLEETDILLETDLKAETDGLDETGMLEEIENRDGLRCPRLLKLFCVVSNARFSTRGDR